MNKWIKAPSLLLLGSLAFIIGDVISKIIVGDLLTIVGVILIIAGFVEPFKKNSDADKKILDSLIILIGFFGTLLISFSVSESQYGFGVSKEGDHFPMAMINLVEFQIGIRLIVVAFVLQIITLWFFNKNKENWS